MSRTGIISLASALPLAMAAPTESKPCPPTATTVGQPQAPPPAAPNSPPPLPPETPDEVELSPAETLVALDKVKKLHYSDLFRAFRAWEIRNCDLVECDFAGGLGYVLKATSTEPKPYLPASASELELTPEQTIAALAAGQKVAWGNQKAAYHDYQVKHAPRPGAPAVGVNFETVRSWALRQAQAVAGQQQPAVEVGRDEHNPRLVELLC